MSVESLLAQGEQTVGDPILFPEPQNPGDRPDIIIHLLEKDGLQTDDEVLLEVEKTDGPAAPCVLIGGEPLNLTVERGTGRLVMMSLDRGVDEDVEREIVELRPGVQATVTPDNRLYWYESDGELAIRDHCDGFNEANEPSLEKMANGVFGVLQAAILSGKLTSRSPDTNQG